MIRWYSIIARSLAEDERAQPKEDTETQTEQKQTKYRKPDYVAAIAEGFIGGLPVRSSERSEKRRRERFLWSFLCQGDKERTETIV